MIKTDGMVVGIRRRKLEYPAGKESPDLPENRCEAGFTSTRFRAVVNCQTGLVTNLSNREFLECFPKLVGMDLSGADSPGDKVT